MNKEAMTSVVDCITEVFGPWVAKEYLCPSCGRTLEVQRPDRLHGTELWQPHCADCLVPLALASDD